MGNPLDWKGLRQRCRWWYGDGGGHDDTDGDSGSHGDIDGYSSGYGDIDGDCDMDGVRDTKYYPNARIVVLYGQ